MNRHRILICLGVILISGQCGLAAPIYLETKATIASAGYLGEEGWQSSDTQGGSPPAEFYNPIVDGFLQWEFGTGYWLAESQAGLQPTEMYLSGMQTNEVGATASGLPAGVSASADNMIRFTLDMPHRFTLRGDINRTAVSGFPGALPRPDDSLFSALIEIQGSSEVRRLEYELGDESALFLIAEDGVLAPGEYTFHARILDEFDYQAAPVGSYSGGSSFTLSLQLAQVPEPSGWQLLAIGTALVGGLASWRRISQRHRRLRQSLAMLLLFAPCGRLVAAEFQHLGDLSGGRYESDAKAVSADGKTVVGVSSSAVGWRAFRWTQAEGLVGLDDMAEAAAVSADGSVIVGGSQRWTAANGIEELEPFPPDGEDIQASDVSADGTVVAGFGRRSSNSPFEAFRWTEATGAIGLGVLPGYEYSYAIGISADGLVLVGFSEEPTYEAFRWTAGGGMMALGDLDGGFVYSFASDASADGAVVVGEAGSDYLDPLFGTEAFRWTEAEGMVGLGYLDEHPISSDAMAVSDDGRVIVGASSSERGQKAFIWDAKHGMRSLQQLLLDAGVTNLAGWQLNRAWGISADGTVIVGSGTNPDGKTEAWRAVVPEPGSFTLATLAIAGWLFRRPLRCRHG